MTALISAPGALLEESPQSLSSCWFPSSPAPLHLEVSLFSQTQPIQTQWSSSPQTGLLPIWSLVLDSDRKSQGHCGALAPLQAPPPSLCWFFAPPLSQNYLWNLSSLPLQRLLLHLVNPHFILISHPEMLSVLALGRFSSLACWVSPAGLTCQTESCMWVSPLTKQTWNHPGPNPFLLTLKNYVGTPQISWKEQLI